MEEGALAIHYFHMIGGGGYSIDGLQEIRHFGLFDYLKKRWRTIADQYIAKKNQIMAKHVKYIRLQISCGVLYMLLFFSLLHGKSIKILQSG